MRRSWPGSGRTMLVNPAPNRICCNTTRRGTDAGARTKGLGSRAALKNLHPTVLSCTYMVSSPIRHHHHQTRQPRPENGRNGPRATTATLFRVQWRCIALEVDSRSGVEWRNEKPSGIAKNNSSCAKTSNKKHARLSQTQCCKESVLIDSPTTARISCATYALPGPGPGWCWKGPVS